MLGEILPSQQSRGSRLTVIVPAVDAEVVEPMPLGQSIEPVLFRNLVAGIVLGGVDLQRFQFRRGGAADVGCPKNGDVITPLKLTALVWFSRL